MSALPLLKFTPSAQDPEILELITVQRETLLATLVDAALDLRGGLRHHLLVGPRGMGKSHVLTIVAERLRKSGERSLVVAALEEDPWAIRSYGKLVAALLATVARETGDRELAEAATKLRSRTGREAEDDGERLLREAVGERRLVLVIENLDEIFRRIGKDGQGRLRALAENWSRMLILGSTPQLFDGINRHTLPFYGFFRITHLDELTPDSAADLLRRVANLRGDEALARFLETETARRRLLAINALAGGHPRIWLLFAGCISIAAIDDLVPLFLEALDDLTPYYQDRLRELGDQQQELVVLLCEAGGALSNRELAERSGLAQNQIAATLGVLERRAYVRRATLPEPLNTGDARVSHWELREPLMRLCLDVKQSRGRPLQLVVDFLRAWYGARILDELGRLPETAKLALTYARAAFAAVEGDMESDYLISGTPSTIIDRARQGLSVTPDSVTLQLALVIGLVGARRRREASEIAWRIFAATPPDDPQWPGAVMLVSTLAVEGASADQDRLHDALEVLGSTDAGVSDATHERHRANALERLGRPEAALRAVQNAIALGPNDPEVHRDLAEMLSGLDRPEAAERAIAQGVAIAPQDIGIRQTAAIIAFERGEDTVGVNRIGEALDLWRPERFDHTLIVSRLLWCLHDSQAFQAAIEMAKERPPRLSAFAQGLVAAIPEMVAANPEGTEEWLRRWRQAITGVEELEGPTRMVEAAMRYARTGEGAHLLALPPDQREIVVSLLRASEQRDDRFQLGHDVT